MLALNDYLVPLNLSLKEFAQRMIQKENSDISPGHPFSMKLFELLVEGGCDFYEFISLLRSIPVINLTAVSGVHDADQQFAVIDGVDDAVFADAQPVIGVVPLQLLNVSASGKPLNGGDDAALFILGKTVDEFLCGLLDDDFIHQEIPHSFLQSSKV